ncbi:ArsR family transcriptional regulator [Salinarchaeum sp. Harcht-Bsk1]|uniref:ArsR/SmtB family transcription factor n=1 Tax=Salinarchaeum sp. Harcht-Bsk1 TaxID=1333523 RepID=UPI00034232DF|nr:metalloregulator ArsR/SmtB family transcription factor [Salinarchaeum sp. Harcht-Bsk1]AGN00424.1 ArsR family transcriptional regulator [Salinarchaeum sp. Harcht-Bsk1]
MDSAALLDLLGNENRRRILRLLARKPCYVTEISEYLGVSPKAVIDHLRKLEDAGLVESHMDERRRKYFHISRNLRLEVNVSPYEFGAKSAYPASRSFDITAWRHLTVDVSLEENGHDPGELASELKELHDLENELSMAQRWVQGRITETVEDLTDAVDGDADGDGRLHADVLVTLADGKQDTTELSEAVDAPPTVVEESLVALAEQGIVDRDEDGWYLREE